MLCMPETSISLTPVCSHLSAKFSPTSVLCCCCQTARTGNCAPKGSVVCNSGCKEHLFNLYAKLMAGWSAWLPGTPEHLQTL